MYCAYNTEWNGVKWTIMNGFKIVNEHYKIDGNTFSIIDPPQYSSFHMLIDWIE